MLSSLCWVLSNSAAAAALLSFIGLFCLLVAFFVWLQAAANGATAVFGAYAALQRVRAFCAPTLMPVKNCEQCSGFCTFVQIF